MSETTGTERAGRTVTCEYGTRVIRLVLKSVEPKLVIDGIDRMYEVVRVELSDRSYHLYDHRVETDAGTVMVRCREKMSHRKAEALTAALWTLLDD